MNTRIRKVWNDLWVRKGRSILTLAGLVMGLWGVGSIGIAWYVLSNDLERNFIDTIPPNLVINTNGFDPQLMAEISAIEGVESIENRPLLGARVQNGPNSWLPMALFVVDDFNAMEVAKVWPGADAFEPPEGEIVIERAGKVLMRFMQSANEGPAQGHGGGSQSDAAARHAPPAVAKPPAPSTSGLKLRLPGGVEVDTRIAGTVFDPGMAPSTMERVVYGYVSASTAQSWLGDPPQSRYLIRLAQPLREIDAQRAMAAQIESLVQLRGGQVAAVVYPPADEHPHQFQLESILFLLGGVGLLMLLLSVVLVINLVNGLLSNQVRQIGSLKAIGASTFQVSMLYLGSMFILGLVASLLALPMALKAGYVISKFLAAFLNFKLFTLQLPATFYLSMIAAGSLFPVLAAVFPVRRWCSAPVRDALENHGVGRRAMQGSLVDRVRLPLPVNLRLGLRNSLRKPKRFMLGLVTVCIGMLVFLVVMNVRTSLLHTAETEIATTRYDISVSFGEQVAWDRISWIEQFPAVEKVELWQAVGAQPVGLPATEVDSFALVAVPEDTQSMLPNLVEGQWVSADEPAGVVVTHRFMNLYPGLKVGDTITLKANGRTIETRLRGINKQFGTTTLYLPDSGFLALTGKEAGYGRLAKIIMIEDPDISIRGMIALLEDHFDMFRKAGQPLKVSGVSTARIASLVIENHLDLIVWILGVMAALMLVVSGLGMASGIGTSLIERTRELGVLRAIGAAPAAVRRILIAETLFISLLAWLISIAMAPALSRLVSSYFGAGIVEYPFDYQTSSNGILLSLVVVIVLTLIATLGPARSAGRLSVSRAVSYE